MTEPLKIGLAGLGTVGTGVVQLLREDAEVLAARAGRPLKLVHVASRTPKPEVDLGGASFSTDVLALPDRDDVDTVVELIGGEGIAKTLFERCIETETSFVTANKALVALHGNELLQRALDARIPVGFEAAVAGGIPIINALSAGLAANRIEWLAGIINGTSNYILTAMANEGAAFADALAEAQRLGFAEADPTFDVEGIDAAHKLTILASLAFDVPYSFENIYTEGIANVDVEDIHYAKELGYSIRHLGVARRVAGGIDARVHPTLVPDDLLLAKVEGVMNAVMVNGHAVGSTLYTGPGAGSLPTASAVVADLVELARGNLAVPRPAGQGASWTSIDELECAHYLYIPVVDRAGVFAELAEILSGDGISIEAVIQKPDAVRSAADSNWVPVVILTDVVSESAIRSAVESIQQLPDVVGDIRRLRAFNLPG